MATARYSGYTASVVYAGPTTLNLKQITGHEISMQRSLTEVLAAGLVERSSVIESHSDPMVRITSADLTTIIGAISPSIGLSCTGGATFRGQTRLQGGVFDTAATHVTYTSQLGWIGINSISASQDDLKGAVCELSYYPLWDGTNNPLVYTGTVAAFAGIDPAFNSQFYLGPVYLGSTQLEGVRSVSINFGMEFRPKRADGDPYARIGAIYIRRPEISINFEKLANNATVGLFSSNYTGNDIKCYFWKGSSGGVRTAVANASHCKVTAAEGTWGSESVAFSEEEDQSLTVKVTTFNTAVTAVVNSAIP